MLIWLRLATPPVQLDSGPPAAAIEALAFESPKLSATAVLHEDDFAFLICGGNGGPGDSYRYTTVECFAGATGKKVKDTAHAKQIVAELQDAVMKVRATGGIDAAVARVRGAGRTA